MSDCEDTYFENPIKTNRVHFEGDKEVELDKYLNNPLPLRTISLKSTLALPTNVSFYF